MKNTTNYINLVSSVLEKAVEWNYLRKNVAKNVTIQKNYNKQKRTRNL